MANPFFKGFDPKMDFSDGLKLMLLSFDSTIKANISVGLPIDFQIYEAVHTGPNGRFIRMIHIF